MRKKEGSIKDISILNYQILKRKTRSTGESICLCTMEKDSKAILVVSLNSDGHIVDSQVFVWTDTTKKQIMSFARKAFNDMQKQWYEN